MVLVPKCDTQVTIFVLFMQVFKGVLIDSKSVDLVMNLFTGKLMVLKCCCLHRMANLYSLWTNILNFLWQLLLDFLHVKLGILYLSSYVCIQVKADSKSRLYSLIHSLTKIYFADRIVKLVWQMLYLIAAELYIWWRAKDLQLIVPMH